MSATTKVRIRRIGPDDGLVLRDLRLRSLRDAPEAFGQPLEEARRQPEREWHRSAHQSSLGHGRIWLIAEAGTDPVGLVQGRRRHPDTLLLFSMWVDPASRRRGIGRALIEALEGWARGWGGSETILWVVAENTPAIEFYRDLGFEPVGSGQDADAGARFGALAMRRSITRSSDAVR